MVTEQLSPNVNGVSGFTVYELGPPETTAVCALLTVHSIVSEDAPKTTSSVNVTPMLAFASTLDAPSPGVVDETAGATSVHAPSPKQPRPLNVSVAKPIHCAAGSNASVSTASPASTRSSRLSVLSAVLVSPVPHSAPGSNPSWPIESMTVAPLRSSTASSPLNQPAEFV